MKKRKRGRRKPKFIMTLLVFLLVAATVFYFKDNIESMLGSLGRFFSGADSEINYSGYADKTYTEVDGCVAVVSSRGIQVIDLTGQQTLSDNFELSEPAVRSFGKYAAAYDIGGKTVKVFTSDEILYSCEDTDTVISANVNEKGYAAVCSKEESYNGLVTVYNNEGKKILDWYSGEAYVISACLSSDSDTVAVLGVTENGGRLIFLDVGTGEEKGRYETGEVLIDMVYCGGSSVDVISETGIITVKENGDINKTYGFGGKYLRNYSLGTNGIHAVILSDYRIGDNCIAVAVKGGRELGTVEDVPTVAKISASGSKFAILTNVGMKIYSKYGNEKASFEDEGDVQDILMMKSGYLIAAKLHSAAILK